MLNLHNPETAKYYGINNCDLVTIETEKGSIKAKAQLNVYVHHCAVGISHGWLDANANLLTSWEVAEPLSSFPNLKAIPCKVHR